jgi:hypothetical protein
MIKFSSSRALFSDFSQAYEGLAGEKLTAPGPFIINAVFVSSICVSEVLIQRTALNRKTSNVLKIQVTYKMTNGTDVTNPNGTLVTLSSPDNDPTVIESSIRCDVKEVDVQILNTTGNADPTAVRVMVVGCVAPGKLFLSNNNK